MTSTFSVLRKDHESLICFVFVRKRNKICAKSTDNKLVRETSMASVRNKKRCVKCEDAENRNGMFTCDGCANAFCGAHVKDHREELNNELEGVVQEHDSIQQQLADSSMQQSLVEKIDQWERRSISKIRAIAEASRRDLQESISKSKQRVSLSCQKIAENLRAARKTENFSEIDLKEWEDQLKNLKLALNFANAYSVIDDKRSKIYPIKIQEGRPASPSNVLLQSESTGDTFGETLGPVTLDKGNRYCTYAGFGNEYGRVRGARKYSQGQTTIHFKVERSESPDQLFFGIMASNADLFQRAWNGPSTVGWCGQNDTWQHGSYQEVTARSINHHFQVGDILQLLIDCDHQLIQLCNERTETSHAFELDTEVVPLPWQFVIGLRTNGDCVSII